MSDGKESRSLQPVGTSADAKLSPEERRALGHGPPLGGIIRFTREKTALAGGELLAAARETERFFRFPVLLALAGTGAAALLGVAGLPLAVVGSGALAAALLGKAAREIHTARQLPEDMHHRWENFNPKFVVRYARTRAERLIAALSKPQADRLRDGLRKCTRRGLPALLARYHELRWDLHALHTQRKQAHTNFMRDHDPYRRKELQETFKRLERVIEAFESRMRETGERITQILLYIERYEIALKLVSVSDDEFSAVSAEMEAFFLNADFEIDSALEVQESMDSDAVYRRLAPKPDSE